MNMFSGFCITPRLCVRDVEEDNDCLFVCWQTKDDEFRDESPDESSFTILDKSSVQDIQEPKGTRGDFEPAHATIKEMVCS